MGVRRCLLAVAIAAAPSLIVAAPAVAAPPLNDEIVNATFVGQLPFTDSLSTVEATTAADDPSCAGNGHTVWYRIELRRDTVTVVAADTVGSDYDTTLSAYMGSPGNLTQIACNDDFSGLQSRIEFSALRRQTVYVMVGSFFGSPGGNLTLSLAESGTVTRLPGFSNSAVNREVSGSYAGSAFFEFSTHGCSFVYQEWNGTYTTTRGGTGTLHVEGCVVTAPVTGGFQFTGSFVLTTPSGASLTGTAEGTVFPVRFTLTLTDSTGGPPQFRNVTGTIQFEASNITGAVTGSLVGLLKHGGVPAVA